MKTKNRVLAAILAALSLLSMAACGDTTPAQTTDGSALTTEPIVTTEPVEDGVTELLTIKELNTNSTVGSHAEEDYNTASMEINFRETVNLNSIVTPFNRYDNAYYPRIKKIKEDLYLLLFMHGELGPHLYYATSKDGVRWNPPNVLFNNGDADKVINYTDGPLAGTTDRYCATNADACVLDNGDILCVYAVRPNKGYHDYPDYNGLWMRRGTVNEKNVLTWGEPEKIYTGHAWEPYIWQRDNGQIEIYWTSIVAYVTMYGFDEDKRSTATMMMVSNDDGYNWTPNIQAGDKNNYVATRIYQEFIGNKVPFGTTMSAVPYFGGQMPSVTKLYNGKTMIAVEVQQLNKTFDVSYAVSEENGVWKELGLLEEGPDTSVRSSFDGASPYLACFPSGEVYMTYTRGRDLYYKLGAPDGSEVASKELLAAPGTYGFWGSCELVGSHEVINAAQNRVAGDVYGIQLVHSYLNHRTNAPKSVVKVDGYTEDWNDNTDALFVGSDSQAQITLRTAHDDDNIYFLISRLDRNLMADDAVNIRIADGEKTYYRISVSMDGTVALSYVEGGFAKKQDVTLDSAVKVLGTVDNNDDTDEGVVFEIAVPKSAVKLTGKKALQVRPELVNVDGEEGKITDSLTDVSATNTTLWPSIVLD